MLRWYTTPNVPSPAPSSTETSPELPFATEVLVPTPAKAPKAPTGHSQRKRSPKPVGTAAT